MNLFGRRHGQWHPMFWFAHGESEGWAQHLALASPHTPTPPTQCSIALFPLDGIRFNTLPWLLTLPQEPTFNPEVLPLPQSVWSASTCSRCMHAARFLPSLFGSHRWGPCCMPPHGGLTMTLTLNVTLDLTILAGQEW
mmetsp:Transcript_16140/g.28609  ORF Transcript_16140/g.28609 Transcript_16140/m.28609 type:complete len:138 (-) Transcript_16140:50-463(-)